MVLDRTRINFISYLNTSRLRKRAELVQKNSSMIGSCFWSHEVGWLRRGEMTDLESGVEAPGENVRSHVKVWQGHGDWK